MGRLPWRRVLGVVGFVLFSSGCRADKDEDEAHAKKVARGEYLVEHVTVCGDCHTPRDDQGQLDRSQWLAGVPNFVDIAPEAAGVGGVSAPNLTPDETGLRDWTDEQIKNAFLNGVDEDNHPLFPIMPYYVLHNMTSADAEAIVAYLRQIPAVEHRVPEREPLPFPFEQPAQPVPASAIPDTTLSPSDPNYESAVRGKYLAGQIGVCMECHTPEPATQGPIPIDINKLFAGGRAFSAAALGLPQPPFPQVIYSRNITPHADGILGWTAEQVRTSLKKGVDDEGQGICPPMPVGPMGAFGGLTDEDALAIGHYLTTIAPVANSIPEDCTPPTAP